MNTLNLTPKHRIQALCGCYAPYDGLYSDFEVFKAQHAQHGGVSITRVFELYGTKRVVFRCCDKRCKHVWVMEFDLDALNEGRFASGNTILSFYIHKNMKCPKCGYPVAKTNEIIGHKNDTPCDRRCTDAKGHDCDCSCGGENHGRTYQIH